MKYSMYPMGVQIKERPCVNRAFSLPVARRTIGADGNSQQYCSSEITVLSTVALVNMGL